MALINCYECNQKISSRANSCPNCGAPKISKKKKEDLNSLRPESSENNSKEALSKEISPNPIRGLFYILGSCTLIIIISSLFQSKGNNNSYLWAQKNKKFIAQVCTKYDRLTNELNEGCKSLIYQLGSESKNIPFSHFTNCTYSLKSDKLSDYKDCILKEKLKADQRDNYFLNKKREADAREQKFRRILDENQRLSEENSRRDSNNGSSSILDMLLMKKILDDTFTPPKVFPEKRSTKCRTTYNGLTRSYETICD